MRCIVSQETVAQKASCTEDKQFLSQERQIYKNNQWLSCVSGTSESVSHSFLIAPSACPARSPAPPLPPKQCWHFAQQDPCPWHKQSVIVLMLHICLNINENRNAPSYLHFFVSQQVWMNDLFFVMWLCVHVTLCSVLQVELHPVRWPLSQSVHGAEDSWLSHCGAGSERMHCDQRQFGHQHPRRE